jgi:hypothetical protein
MDGITEPEAILTQLVEGKKLVLRIEAREVQKKAGCITFKPRIEWTLEPSAKELKQLERELLHAANMEQSRKLIREFRKADKSRKG